MKILIIIPTGLPFNENSILTTGCGGSETWAIQLSNAFCELGHEVMVLGFSAPHYARNGVQYVPIQESETVLRTRKFDLIISSRMHGNLIEVVDAFKTSDNVFIQAHDTFITGTDFSEIKKYPCFKGVSTLSAYQERTLHDENGVEWSYMHRIGNGIDERLFSDLDFTPKNQRLLWSSNFSRGGDIAEDHIVPAYIKKIAEGGIDFCGYSNIESKRGEHVKILGSLNKPDLYKQMCDRYCWFYPSTFGETFCISLIENVMCENDLILPLDYGPMSVLEPFYPDITMKHKFDGGEDEFKLAVDEAAEKIVDSIENHEAGQELRSELKNYVLQNYTWTEVAKKWIKLV